MSQLPTRRSSLEGQTYEGDRLRLSLSIAKSLYRCPACRESIPIGSEHVFVHYLDADPPWDHEHWHSVCVSNRLLRSFASSVPVPAPKPPRHRSKRR